MGAAPALVYLAAFCLLTWPLILSFPTHLFLNMQDGLQNVWNLWWVNKAVTELHQSPWHTTYLHHPFGVTLLGHTLNPFNGLLGIPLHRLVDLVSVHNFLIVFSFVVGGLTAFALAYRLTGSYAGSLLAGYVFSFTSYHFVHLQAGHMQLVSLEFIPLFLLCFLALLETPALCWALASAGVLLLVLLCDHYYFLFCVLAGALIVVFKSVRVRRLWFLFEKERCPAVLIFMLAAFAACAPLVTALALANRADPLLGAHPAAQYSLDLAAPLLPGGSWRFASWTQPVWSAFRAGRFESSSLGLALAAALILVALFRKRLDAKGVGLWYCLLIFFGLLSLGPALHVGGTVHAGVPMPYAIFARIFPPLELGGCPARMMAMVMLCAGVICAYGLAALPRAPRWATTVCAALAALMVVEHLPAVLSPIRLTVPPYVTFLKTLPQGAGVLDTTTDMAPALYFQTIHEKPVAGGYVSRIPKSLLEREIQLGEDFKAGRLDLVCGQYGIRYWVAPTKGAYVPALTGHDIRYWTGPLPADGLAPSENRVLVFKGGGAAVFDLDPHGNCRQNGPAM